MPDPLPVVAAFDLDGTLTEGGSVVAWLRFIAGPHATVAALARLAVPLTVGAIRSGPSADGAKERLFEALLAGRELDEVVTRSRVFALEHLTSRIRPRVAARLAWHRSQGHDVVVVSASPDLYVQGVADQLGAVGALGTRLAVDDGRLTGRYLSQNCRGSEKLRRLEEWTAQRNYASAPETYAYGNSRGDRRLLAGAAHPFNVGRLGRVGALRSFPRLASR